MSRTLFRALSFSSPGLATQSGHGGVTLDANGAAETVHGTDSIRQAIALLLSTRPGERVMRPEYGCDIHRLVFAPNDDTTAGLAAHYVRIALHVWEPRIEVLRVDVEQSEAAPAQLTIAIDYRVRQTGQHEAMYYAFSLAGESS